MSVRLSSLGALSPVKAGIQRIGSLAPSARSLAITSLRNPIGSLKLLKVSVEQSSFTGLGNFMRSVGRNWKFLMNNMLSEEAQGKTKLMRREAGVPDSAPFTVFAMTMEDPEIEAGNLRGDIEELESKLEAINSKAAELRGGLENVLTDKGVPREQRDSVVSNNPKMLKIANTISELEAASERAGEKIARKRKRLSELTEQLESAKAAAGKREFSGDELSVSEMIAALEAASIINEKNDDIDSVGVDSTDSDVMQVMDDVRKMRDERRSLSSDIERLSGNIGFDVIPISIISEVTPLDYIGNPENSENIQRKIDATPQLASVCKDLVVKTAEFNRLGEQIKERLEEAGMLAEAARDPKNRIRALGKRYDEYLNTFSSMFTAGTINQNRHARVQAELKEIHEKLIKANSMLDVTPAAAEQLINDAQNKLGFMGFWINNPDAIPDQAMTPVTSGPKLLGQAGFLPQTPPPVEDTRQIARASGAEKPAFEMDEPSPASTAAAMPAAEPEEVSDLEMPMVSPWAMPPTGDVSKIGDIAEPVPPEDLENGTVVKEENYPYLSALSRITGKKDPDEAIAAVEQMFEENRMKTQTMIEMRLVLSFIGNQAEYNSIRDQIADPDARQLFEKVAQIMLDLKRNQGLQKDIVALRRELDYAREFIDIKMQNIFSENLPDSLDEYINRRQAGELYDPQEEKWVKVPQTNAEPGTSFQLTDSMLGEGGGGEESST